MSQRNHAANNATAVAHRMKTRNVIVCGLVDRAGIEPALCSIHLLRTHLASSHYLSMLFVCLLVGVPLLRLWGLAPRTFTASIYGDGAEPLRWSCRVSYVSRPFTAFSGGLPEYLLAPRDAFTCRVW